MLKINKKSNIIYPPSEYINGRLTNFDIDYSGTISKVGYSTLREFIKHIRIENKKLKKIGASVTYTITLPIKY